MDKFVWVKNISHDGIDIYIAVLPLCAYTVSDDRKDGHCFAVMKDNDGNVVVLEEFDNVDDAKERCEDHYKKVKLQ